MWGHAESEFDFTARLSKNKHDYIILKAFVKKQKLDRLHHITCVHNNITLNVHVHLCKRNATWVMLK